MEEEPEPRGEEIEPIPNRELLSLRARFEALRLRLAELRGAQEELLALTDDLGAEAFRRLRESGAAEAQVARFEEAKERAAREAAERLEALQEAARRLHEAVDALASKT